MVFKKDLLLGGEKINLSPFSSTYGRSKKSVNFIFHVVLFILINSGEV